MHMCASEQICACVWYSHACGMCMYVCACVCVHVWLKYVYACMCVWFYMHVRCVLCVFMCVCVHVWYKYACVCVSVSVWECSLICSSRVEIRREPQRLPRLVSTLSFSEGSL